MRDGSRSGRWRFFGALLASLPAWSEASAQVALSLRRADGAATPVLRYQPDADRCLPVMVISHGFGGDERALRPLASAMAGQGWRVFVMGHRESGRAQLRAALATPEPLAAIPDAARRPEAHAFRFADLDTTLAEATRLCRPPRLVLAGHSMGAQTTMMEAGARARIPGGGQDRFDAYVALSPQGVGGAFADGAWRGVRKPVLMLTGTRDRSTEGGYATRLSAFDGLPPGQKRIAIISGAGHLQIGGIGSAAVAATVNALVVEFLDHVGDRRWRRSRIDGAEVIDK